MEALQRAGRVLSELRLSVDLYFVLEPLITRRPPCALATIATSRQRAAACVCVPECLQQPSAPLLAAQARACAARKRRARALARAAGDARRRPRHRRRRAARLPPRADARAATGGRRHRRRAR